MSDDTIDFTNLDYHWERAKVKHILSPVYQGVRMTAELLESIKAHHIDELFLAFKVLWNSHIDLAEEMIDKKAVAKILGLTVSWLDNSYCEKARRLRAIGVRFGTSQTSPVRFPRSHVQVIARINEATAPDKV